MVPESRSLVTGGNATPFQPKALLTIGLAHKTHIGFMNSPLLDDVASDSRWLELGRYHFVRSTVVNWTTAFLRYPANVHKPADEGSQLFDLQLQGAYPPLKSRRWASARCERI